MNVFRASSFNRSSRRNLLSLMTAAQIKADKFVMNLRQKILALKLFIRRTWEPSLPVKQLLLLPKENGASA